jgi:2,3-dihydroxybiphenyl 1,2-dioxygenase
MAGVRQLGYLGISVSDREAWKGYARDLLGLEAVREEGDTLYLRMDSRDHRFELLTGGGDDIAYAGWEVDGPDALAEVGAQVEAAGFAVRAGTREETERRHVTDVIVFDDPDGHRTEVFHGAETAAEPFESPKSGRGFIADDLGLGHFVLDAADLQRAMDFYTGALGMKVSDYISMGAMRMGFLHCNPRHHSLAFAEVPRATKRINHFMLQSDSIDDVGKTYDRVQEGTAPLLMTLGRHSNDHMVSFYMANPSKFGVEFGWGGREVDDSCWQVEHLTTGSLWGHRRPPKPGTN